MAEGVDRKTKLLSKFPWLFGPQTAVFSQTSYVDGLSDVSGARRVPFLSKTTCFYTTICFSEVLLSVFTSDKRLVFYSCDLQVGLL